MKTKTTDMDADNLTVVKIWVSLTSIGDIDAIRQRYTCEFLMTATWSDPTLQGKKNEDIDWSKEWNPKITFINASNIDSVQTRQRLHCVAEGHDVIQQFYRVRGTFRSVMDLVNFPLDFQELSITLSSEWPDKHIEFQKDLFKEDNIDARAGGSPHWSICEHVHTDGNTLVHKVPGPSNFCQPLYIIKCHVIRNGGHYVWNIMLLMFFITGLSFASFSYNPYQLIVALMTLLTGVAFKFAASNNLPSIPYPTLLDKYFVIHLLFICLVIILNIGSTTLPKNNISTYNFACMIGGLALFLVMETTCGIIAVFKLRAMHRVEVKYHTLYQKIGDEIDRLRRERDWYAERNKQPKTPTILLTPATREFTFPSNGSTPKSRKEQITHDSTKSYV